MTSRHFDNTFPSTPPSDFQALDGEMPARLSDAHTQRIWSVVSLRLDELRNAVERTVDHSDTSMYTGLCGISLLYIKLYEARHSKNHLAEAQKLLEECLLQKSRKNRRTFLCGRAGPISLAAYIAFLQGQESQSRSYLRQLLDEVSDVITDEELPNELLFGRVGFIYALLYVRERVKSLRAEDREEIDEAIGKIVDEIIHRGQYLAHKLQSDSPLLFEWHGSLYLGAAHGLAGIFYVLLRCSVYIPRCRKHDPLIRSSIDYLMTLRYPSGNYPSSIREGGEDKLVHWCHGAPGFLHMFVAAYDYFRDEKYLQEALCNGQVIWERGLLRKGYGLCHGAPGNAYGFLVLYQTTKDPLWLYRALCFAEWCFDYGKHGCKVADRPYSLFEGLAGMLYFLTDLLHPDEAAFPGFNI